MPFGAPLTLSDVRLKRDIFRVARLDNGIDLYRYRYTWSDQLYVGVMAEEVAEVMPSAVMRGVDGYLRVDYGRVGLRLMTWDEWAASSGERSRTIH
jgi:endosialidase-like protein